MRSFHIASILSRIAFFQSSNCHSSHLQGHCTRALGTRYYPSHFHALYCIWKWTRRCIPQAHTFFAKPDNRARNSAEDTILLNREVFAWPICAVNIIREKKFSPRAAAPILWSTCLEEQYLLVHWQEDSELISESRFQWQLISFSTSPGAVSEWSIRKSFNK